MSDKRNDYDMREISQLHSMRKVFEEMRVADGLNDFTSDELISEDNKLFDGTVVKDNFVYAMLSREEFTLTRTEVANICSLMLNISKKDEREAINLDELQYSYCSYMKYHELVEARVID